MLPVPYFASYDQTKLWYHIIGAGPPLVCLAGGPGADVRELGDLGGLDRYNTLVLLDARAAGRSAVPTDEASCAFTEQARDVNELRRHLGLDRVDVLAHSAGCLTGQEFAARYSPHLGKLVLVTPTGRVAREPDEVEVTAIRASRAAEPWYAAAQTSDDDDALAPFFFGKWSPAARQHYENHYPDPPAWLREAYYRSAATGPAAAARLARLAAVPNPVLAAAGELDGMIGTKPAQLVAACYPLGRLEILPGCGHWPWIDQPAHFTNLIHDFLTT